MDFRLRTGLQLATLALICRDEDFADSRDHLWSELPASEQKQVLEAIQDAFEMALSGERQMDLRFEPTNAQVAFLEVMDYRVTMGVPQQVRPLLTW